MLLILAPYPYPLIELSKEPVPIFDIRPFRNLFGKYGGTEWDIVMSCRILLYRNAWARLT